MEFRGPLVLVLAAVLVKATSTAGQEVEGEQVGEMVGQVVEQHLTGCHLVLLTTSTNSPLVSAILKRVSEPVLVAGGSFDQQNLPQELWGDSRNCRALIFHIGNSNNNTNTALRQLEKAGLRKFSETRVVVVGGRTDVKAVLLHHSLRNTVHGLYLALHPDTLITSYPGPYLYSRITYQDSESGERQGVWVYRRCLYCNNGEAGVQFIYHWNFTSLSFNNPGQDASLFHGEDQLFNFGGHNLKYIAVHYFPYIEFTRDSDQPYTTVTPKDSLDLRLIITLAKKMNFTYTIFGEPNNSWGEPKDGDFSGLAGYLQREEVDASTIAVPTDLRLKVASFIRSYPTDLMTVISLKPQPLPKHSVFIRPFTGTVWVAVLVSGVVLGAMLWVMQGIWSNVTGGSAIDFSTALLYSWGALLEVPPPYPSCGASGKMLVGWWLMFCVVMFTGYQSTLISHLTINTARTQPPETMEDLVQADGWKWGIKPWILSGVPLEYFTTHTDPVVKTIYKELEAIGIDDALKKILNGRYSLIDLTYYSTIHISSYYSDDRGNTPFFISKNGFTFMSIFGWGFRLGAPFYHRFDRLTLQLEAQGITDYWLEQLIAKKVKESRAKAVKKDTETTLKDNTEVDSGEIVLGLDHLQGAFYLLILGTGASILTLLGENSVHSRTWLL